MLNIPKSDPCEMNLSDLVSHILTLDQVELDTLNSDFAFREKTLLATRQLVEASLSDEKALNIMQTALSCFFDYQFSIPEAEQGGRFLGGLLSDIASELTRGLFSQEERYFDLCLFEEMPREGQAYVSWLRRLIHDHWVFNHEIYDPFLAKHATRENMKYFFAQETTLDPKFDDCLALMQLGTTGLIKLELAHNYWDEMGNGKPEEVHTALFSHVIDELGITPEYVKSTLSTISKSSGNLSAGVCFDREHFYKAIGYFGVSEYLAPSRFKKILLGFNRLNFSDKSNLYHDLHITVDTGHAQGWFKNVIAPLVDKSEHAAREITRGAFYRLNNSARYLDAALEHMKAMNYES